MEFQTKQIAGLEQTFAHIEKISTSLPIYKKVQLHTGMDGFNSPDSFGIYKDTGGDALGVVGSVFNPCNLQLFLDSLVKSSLECDCGLQLHEMKFNEYKGGSKIAFEVPYKSFQLKTKLVGDITDISLMFTTGFDGLTKMQLGFQTMRLVCSNGARRADKNSSIDISFKNTLNNQAKVLTWTNEINIILGRVNGHIEELNTFAGIEVTQTTINAYLSKVTGYDVSQYNELTTRKRNILDSINAAVAIEMGNTGTNLFSLVQGVTRYTTHDLGKGNPEGILFDNGAKLNEAAHFTALQMVMAN